MRWAVVVNTQLVVVDSLMQVVVQAGHRNRGGGRSQASSEVCRVLRGRGGWMGTAMGGQLIVHGSHIPQDRVSDVGGHEFTNVSGVIAFHFMHACMQMSTAQCKSDSCVQWHGDSHVGDVPPVYTCCRRIVLWPCAVTLAKGSEFLRQTPCA